MPHNLHLSNDLRDQWINDDRESREGDFEHCDRRAQHPQHDAIDCI
jgi:hypothetical protein